MLVVLNVWGASHHPQEFLNHVKNDVNASQKIYNQFCANCHNPKPLIPLGAPEIGNTSIWQKRAKSGFANLLHSTINGKGLMPARGGCFECTDEQLEMIIKYMINYKKEH